MAACCPPPWLLRVLIALSLARAVYSVSSESVYGAVNQSVTFHVSNSLPLTEILWTKEKDKVAEWDYGSQPRVFPPFEGRIHLDITSGNLNISGLSSKDEGVYEFDNTKKFSLIVFEPLPSPEISFKSNNSSIIVTCSIPASYQSHLENVKVSWNCSVPKCANSSTFDIVFGETDDHPQKICCIVSNPLFQANSSISLVPDSSAHYPRKRWFLILSALTLAVAVYGIFNHRQNTRSPGNVEQASESKPACDESEGTFPEAQEQASELLQKPESACDEREDE